MLRAIQPDFQARSTRYNMSAQKQTIPGFAVQPSFQMNTPAKYGLCAVGVFCCLRLLAGLILLIWGHS